jgi:hypothetical protein
MKPTPEKKGEAKAPAEKPHGRSRSVKDGPEVKGGSPDARKRAAAVLEVLGGILKPTQAASALSMALSKYYQMEKRALQALISGCEPVPTGRRPKDSGREAEKMRRQIVRLEQDCARYQAIARAAQRTLGLFPPTKEGKDKAGRKARTPCVRSLKIAATLKKDAEPNVTITPVSG